MGDQIVKYESLALADLDRPALSTLSYALRHPETWPDSFHWNYENCSSCAIGLAFRLWKGIKPKRKDAEWMIDLSVMAKNFAIPYEEAQKIFIDQKPPFSFRRPFADRSRSAVTPEQVADAIDEYIASAP